MSTAMPAVPLAPGTLPLLGHLHHMSRRRKRLEFMDGLRDHGKVVRIRLGAGSAYVITDAELTRDMLVSRQSRTFVKGGRFFEALGLFLGPSSLGTVSDVEEHRRHRHLLQPMFNRAHLDRQGDVVVDRMRELVGAWPAGEPVEICSEMDALTLAAFLTALFGADLPAAVAEEFRRLVPVMMRGTLYHAFLPSWVTRLPLPAGLRYAAPPPPARTRRHGDRHAPGRRRGRAAGRAAGRRGRRRAAAVPYLPAGRDHHVAVRGRRVEQHHAVVVAVRDQPEPGHRAAAARGAGRGVR